MAATDSAAKRTRALISTLREVGENGMADLVERALVSGGTPKANSTSQAQTATR